MHVNIVYCLSLLNHELCSPRPGQSSPGSGDVIDRWVEQPAERERKRENAAVEFLKGLRTKD